MEILAITLADLRYRYRQFLITVVGASLVFAMGLLLSGMAAGFKAEIGGVVNASGANWWVMAKTGSGRLGALPTLPESTLAAVAREPGVAASGPFILGGQAATIGTSTQEIVVIGTVPGGLGTGLARTGRSVTGSGQAVVDSSLGVPVGTRFSVAGVPLQVVGTVSQRTLFAGQSVVYVSLHDAQRILYLGRPLIGAVLVEGTPTKLPPGLIMKSKSQVTNASLTQMSSAVSSISNTRWLMWAIAAFIVAALVYVTSLQRTRDFAVLKALGASSGLLFVGLVIQAVIVALAAAAFAALISTQMTGLFAQRVDIPGSAFFVLPLAALGVGIFASLAALRRAVGADPATAFSG